MPILILLCFPVIDIIFSVWLIFEHGWVLLFLLLTSGLGIFMLRHHRLIIIQTLISRMNTGQLPALFWVARYYVAAILFAFPGILTDFLAVLFLIPWQGKMARAVSPDEVIEAEFTREAARAPHTLPPDDNDAPSNKRNKP